MIEYWKFEDLILNYLLYIFFLTVKIESDIVYISM